jgi:Na+/H+-dicarboxylate symporter
LISGILFGLAAHALLPDGFRDVLIKWMLAPLGNVFLRGMEMVMIPLVLCSLICSISDMGSPRRLGKIGGKAITYYIATTALAVAIALALSNIVNPGAGLKLALPQGHKTAEVPFIMDRLASIIPANPLEALVKGDLLQIILFAAIFGAAAGLIGKPVKPMLNFLSQVKDIMEKAMEIVMLAAPVGVFALVSKALMLQGIEMLHPLLKYVFTILFVLLVQLLLIYGLILRALGKVEPVSFFKKFQPVMLIALSTSSSSAALPLSLEICQNKLGVSKCVSSLTVPLGTAVNLNGTAIMQGIAALFIAQMFGMELSLAKQLLIMLVIMLASVGASGMPGAGIAALAMVLQQAGIPLEGITLVLSVDMIIGMCRTVVDVTGNAVGAVVIASSEKELDLEVYNG